MNYLSPLFNSPVLNTDVTFLTGGKLYTYEAGTSTPLATYTTQNGSTAHDNPIILNARGLPNNGNPIWLASGREYKFILKDSNNNTIAPTYDDVGGLNDSSVEQSEWQTSLFVPTYISATSFSVTGDRTATLPVGRRLKTTNTGGAVYSTITSSTYGAGITTVVVTNDSGALDSGISVVAYGLLSSTNPSIPNSQAFRQAMGLGYGAVIASAATLDLTARTGNIVRLTGTTGPITTITMANGDIVWLTAASTPAFAVSGVLNYTCTAEDNILVWQDGSGVQHALVIPVNVSQPGQCYLALDGANIRLSPKNGNYIAVGGKLAKIPSAGVTVATAGMLNNTLYYVYAYASSGSVAIEISTTARATDATTGGQIKTGDATRTCVGMAYNNATEVLVTSFFNRSAKTREGSFSASRSTISTSMVELGSEIRVPVLVWSDEPINIAINSNSTNDTNGQATDSAIAIDGAATLTQTRMITNASTVTLPLPTTLVRNDTLAEGYHYATFFGNVTGGTGTWLYAGATLKTTLTVAYRG